MTLVCGLLSCQGDIIRIHLRHLVRVMLLLSAYFALAKCIALSLKSSTAMHCFTHLHVCCFLANTRC